MTEKERLRQPESAVTATGKAPKPYKKPRLTIFGQVARLTEGDQISGNPDGSSGMAGNMGMMGMGSDRRLKENFREVGSHPFGFKLYLFTFKPEFRDKYGQGHQFGVMADDVERVMPEAVSVDPDGYRTVNYAMLGISRTPQ